MACDVNEVTNARDMREPTNQIDTGPGAQSFSFGQLHCSTGRLGIL